MWRMCSWRLYGDKRHLSARKMLSSIFVVCCLATKPCGGWATGVAMVTDNIAGICIHTVLSVDCKYH